MDLNSSADGHLYTIAVLQTLVGVDKDSNVVTSIFTELQMLTKYHDTAFPDMCLDRPYIRLQFLQIPSAFLSAELCFGESEPGVKKMYCFDGIPYKVVSYP